MTLILVLYPCEISVRGRVFELELLLLLPRETGQHAIENMIVPLVRALGHDSRLLQEVLLDLGAFYHALIVEVDVDVFAETGRVVVSHGFRVAEGCDKTYFDKAGRFVRNNNSSGAVISPSSIGFASKICCSIHECFPLIAARYCRINFVLSVFPAPLSPLKQINK